MDEIRKVEEEIARRMDRETVYVSAYLTVPKEKAAFLLEQIILNDEHIKVLGAYLKSKGSEWEKYYDEHRPALPHETR